MQKVNIFGIEYAVTNYHQASTLILEKALARCAFSVFALPVHGVVETRRDEVFMQATLAADLVVPDGQPIRWAMNYFYHTRLAERVYGPRLMNEVLSKANDHDVRVFIYGGSTQQVLDGFRSYVSKNFPNILIVGSYREEIFGEETLGLDRLRDVKPDLVLVGLGCPTQEKWIAATQPKVDTVFMGVGAAFSFYSGVTRMAPAWMQDRGLEWLYRLYKEPRRLWWRYLYYNSYFLVLVIKKLVRLPQT
jgi:N-acetylglucosaminyldiphosphoundecaprenol N-acetyl-beta-D-mannosaminyltransferase